MTITYASPLADIIQKWRLPYKPGPLSEEQYNQFYEDGFVILKSNYYLNF
jgi:hypothetical protein